VPSSSPRASSQVSEAACQAILLALPAQVALLDGSGRVVEVNEAWRHFARINGWNDPNAGVGSSYLTECDTAAGESENEGRAAGAGIRAVLAGIEPRFELEYACHGPTLKRWCCVCVTPTGGGSGGAVVMHMDITERRRIQEELRSSEERFSRIAEVTADGIWDWDLESDTVWRSPGVERLFGVTATMTNSTPWAERLHPEDRSSVLDGMYAAIHGTASHWSSEYRFRRLDGRYAWVSDRASSSSTPATDPR